MTTIAVVGAGPAGLTAAIAGAAAGFDVTVFEQASDVRPAGAAITIQPNGLDVLGRLGLLADFEKRARRMTGAFVEKPDGTILATAHEAVGAALTRTDLQTLLQDAAAAAGARLVFGRRCVDVADDGELSFEDGTARFDLVVAADGIHSVAREALRFHAKRRAIGYAALRGIADVAPGDTAAHEIWGPRGRFFLLVPLSDTQTYFACTAPDAGFTDMRDADIDRWSEPWTGYNAWVRDIVDSIHWRDLRYDVIEEVIVRPWHRGRAVLIGDAAHAMAPNLGQGANCGMVDALLLIEEFARTGDAKDAARAYESARIRPVSRIQRAARSAGRMTHWSAPFAQALRNTLMRSVNRSNTLRGFQNRLLAGGDLDAPAATSSS